MSLKSTLNEIKEHISLKQETHAGDIIIIGTPDGVFYATVRDIRADIKKNWYAVRFAVLTLPPVAVTWKLRQPQMCGELFTINDQEHFMVAVDFDHPAPNDDLLQKQDTEENTGPPGRVVQFIPRKK